MLTSIILAAALVSSTPRPKPCESIMEGLIYRSLTNGLELEKVSSKYGIKSTFHFLTSENGTKILISYWMVEQPRFPLPFRQIERWALVFCKNKQGIPYVISIDEIQEIETKYK